MALCVCTRTRAHTNLKAFCSALITVLAAADRKTGEYHRLSLTRSFPMVLTVGAPHGRQGGAHAERLGPRQHRAPVGCLPMQWAPVLGVRAR